MCICLQGTARVKESAGVRRQKAPVPALRTRLITSYAEVPEHANLQCWTPPATFAVPNAVVRLAAARDRKNLCECFLQYL